MKGRKLQQKQEGYSNKLFEARQGKLSLKVLRCTAASELLFGMREGPDGLWNGRQCALTRERVELRGDYKDAREADLIENSVVMNRVDNEKRRRAGERGKRKLMERRGDGW